MGRIGFHERPREGSVEFAWWTAREQRGTGIAAEAVAALIEWAARQGVERVVASIAPDNFASLRVAAKLGFERSGEAIDIHDGLEWIFERRIAQRRLTASTPSAQAEGEQNAGGGSP